MKKLFVVLCLLFLCSCGSGNSSQSAQIVGKWSEKSSTDAPTGRFAHSAVWTGTEMIVWGGFDKSQALSDGKAFNPTTGTWRTIPSVNAPSPRYAHTAIWTGSKMLIWGGSNSYQSGSDVSSGGMYDPSTDSWAAIPSIPGVSIMNYHTAVWTGTHMIVWGGDNGNIGWKFDPITSDWSQLSSVNAPEGCFGHTAVWTGSEMIIWGGRTTWMSTSYLNTGSKYNPISDTWTPISVINPPLARTWHSAVWTGTEMIIWGGQGGDANVVMNTGARYNPSSDTWSSTSVIGAPIAATGQTSVWTGDSMLIIGNYWSSGSDSVYYSGVYYPASDSWLPISNFNSPKSTIERSLIWTGSQIIIWGGKETVPEENLIDSATILTL